jgi:hypothetical protein
VSSRDRSSTSQASGNRRSAERGQVRFSAEYAGKRVEGSGSVANLSHTGGLIEPAEPKLESGACVRLRLSLTGHAEPLEVDAEVVRQSAEGFAVRFGELATPVREALRLEIAQALARDLLGEDDDDSTLPHLERAED